ncbi:MAG: LPS export ABC transporter periplasmic protein LptC [Methylococcaceae bacterium]|nr:LPS export ABC transporter periplasmic protein LptC [Methylococcaceae bacterium]
MNFKHYLYLALLALLSWWLVKLTGLDSITRSNAPLHSADYFSTGYSKWEMDDRGQLKSQLLADQMIHYSDDQTTHMIKPLMYSYNEKNPPWVIKSETGILSADGNNLLLNGKVIIDRAKGPGTKPLTINTSNLKVKLATRYAETKEWAELISPPNRTTGTGMKMVYTQPIRLDLLAHVKGKYETK